LIDGTNKIVPKTAYFRYSTSRFSCISIAMSSSSFLFHYFHTKDLFLDLKFFSILISTVDVFEMKFDMIVSGLFVCLSLFMEKASKEK
jgi:hypothetical protein